MRDRHRWQVPARYNVATAVCDRHPPDKLAMMWEDDAGGGGRVSWGEMQQLAARFGNFLRSQGVVPGDRVAVLLRPAPETAAAVLAALKVGAVAVTMSPLWSDDSLQFRLADCTPKVVFTNAENVDRPPVAACGGAVDLARLDLSAYSADCPTFDTSADDPAFIYYTSGSTGRPKGVVSPHRALLAHNEFEYCQDLRDGELSYWMGDWAWGIYKILGPWRLGAVNAVQSTKRRYDPERLFDFLSRTGVTNLFVNPTGLRLMTQVDDAAKRYPQQFRVCCAANEPLGAAEAEWFESQFGIPVLENYGMTEAYPMVANFRTMPVKRGSIGRPTPGWDVHVLDENGEPVPEGEPGEICLRARSNPQFPLGYWNRPEDTERDFGGEWFRTKDAAYVDEDGYFWHLGRRDDLIKSAGYRISPYEIEQVCERHPEVRVAGVVGVPDAARGQLVKAFLVVEGEPGQGLADSIKDFVRTHHSKFGYPRVVEFVETLPTSQSGKIARAPLRDRAAGTEF
ncbi:MAG: AMP-binding protein [Streptosporangiales bacterium]|nr:AMP-binding protein [Streptosporangiales bacterium]